MASESVVQDRDYTLIIDKSGSMSTADKPSEKTRWQIAQESTLALARKCEEIDPDGITIYLFSGRFRRYDNVTSSKVTQIYQENEPMGRTDLAAVLQTILVITDGEPDDRKAVMRQIIEASRKLDSDQELAISLIQVGNDRQATEFLKALDDQLESAGAKFDIVDTITIDDMEDMTLAEVLLNAITG
ncbi:MAG: VWA domain-containing protein [Microcystis aeruginosa Ma_AC_P_19900807_S299]|nr:MAG: VWA domain-containing protein [Microcystis aeruginosa Ma_AC_P_19900807_S299]